MCGAQHDFQHIQYVAERPVLTKVCHEIFIETYSTFLPTVSRRQYTPNLEKQTGAAQMFLIYTAPELISPRTIVSQTKYGPFLRHIFWSLPIREQLQ